jgi:NADH pyrophosphatase NudC (nudix superfamily)
MDSYNTASAQAVRILRDKQTGIVDEFAWRELKHAQEYLCNEESKYCPKCGRPMSEPHCGYLSSWQ